jgi:hypothetical protein
VPKISLPLPPTVKVPPFTLKVPAVLGSPISRSVNCTLIGLTVRETLVVLLKEPEVPVTGITYVPGIVETLVASVSDDVAAPAIEFGANVAVTPAGRLVALRATAELNPFCGVVAMVKDAPPPA